MMNLPTRKEMNEDRMKDLVSELAEYVGGDNLVHSELFDDLFSDLSASKQEKWLAYMNSRIRQEKLEIRQNVSRETSKEEE